MADSIKNIRAQKILDSRGNWTVEIDVQTKNGLFGKGIAPSGASTGIYEAKVLDAEKSVGIVNSILSKMSGLKLDQELVDAKLKSIDGTSGFSKIGGNTAIAMSFAVYNLFHKEPSMGGKSVFPYPLGNIFGGGAHGGGVDIQEFLICPTKAKNFQDCVERMVDTYHGLKKEIEKKCDAGINDEGAITAKISLENALDMISKISGRNECRIGLDVASSNLWDGRKYVYPKMKKSFDPGAQIDFISDLIKTYRLFYVEDPLNEDDFSGFRELTKKLGKKCLICGDDLTTTKPARIKKAILHKSINAAIVKPNQIGTISLAHEFVNLAKKDRIVPVISHRSAETADSTISIMALDWKIPIIKAGVIDIRIAKLNTLLDLWDECERPAMNKISF